MRRVIVYRDGNQMAAQIGPDWVQGIAGFGDTVADAVREISRIGSPNIGTNCVAIRSESK